MSSSGNSSTQNEGSHRKGSNSASSILSTLIPSFLIALALFIGFIILRRKLHRVYSPRTYIDVLQHEEKTPKSKKGGMFGWIGEFRKLPDEYVLNHQSLDQYLFLRFFKMITIMCLVGCIITWPILFPVNATGGGGQSQLDILSMSNVANVNRYYAHAFVAIIFLGFVMFMITRETVYFINLRHAYLMAPHNASRLSARTVLFTGVPEAELSEGHIRKMFSGIRRVWIATDCKKLEKMIEERDKAVIKLEGAEVKLSTMANKNRLKSKQPATREKEHSPEGAAGIESQWVDRKKRPSHKTKFLIGKKVDTIEWSKEHVPEMIAKANAEQMKHRNQENIRLVGAVFIEFETQHAAQAALQTKKKELPHKVKPRFAGQTPDQVVWKNLGMKPVMRLIRTLIAVSIITFMIIFWTIPVAFIGVLTNINYITDKVPFLSFINKIPSSILGVITGLLPVVLLAILMALVPKFCRFLAKFSGEKTLAGVELKTQSWYFAFQVVQVFLITTFSSGAATVATQIINDPTQAPTLLAKNLPKASNFYLSYFILFGLGMSSKALFNIGGLLTVGILGRFFDKTPRKIYKRYVNLTALKWGTVYPKFTNLAVIAISYSCIAPLVLGFATIGLYLIYLAYRYSSFYTLTTEIDTQGLAYGRALNQMFVGIYLSELCLIGLFAIGVSDNKAATGPLVIMLLFLVVTIIYHALMYKKLHKRTTTLPLSLLEENHAEWSKQQQMENGVNGYNGANGYDRTDGHAVVHETRMHPGFENAHTTGGQLPAADLHDGSAGYHNGPGPGLPQNGHGTQNRYDPNSNAPLTNAAHSHDHTTLGTNDSSPHKTPMEKQHDALPTTSNEKHGTLISRFLHPNKHASYGILKDRMRTPGHSFAAPLLGADVARDAYIHPAIWSEAPIMWIPKDAMGISEQEVRSTPLPLKASHNGAWFDEKGHVVIDKEDIRNVPVWRDQRRFI